MMALRMMVKITRLMGNFSVFLEIKVAKKWNFKKRNFLTYMSLQNTKYLSSVMAVVVYTLQAKNTSHNQCKK